MPRQRCAILDDYQNVVLKITDWSKVSGDLDIKVFNQHLGSQENVIKALQGFEIVCAMRERTAFPRAVIEKLPHLYLLNTTGLRNAAIDIVAAKVLVEDVDVEIARNLRPVRYLEYDILVVVEDRAALARHGECPWLARGWGGEDGASL